MSSTDDDIDFTPVTSIDSNVWYHLSEYRVANFDSTFGANLNMNSSGELGVFSMEKVQQWQFHPVDTTNHPGRYSLRLSLFGIYKQLAVCFEPLEQSKPKTKICMRDSLPDEEEQMWDIADWGNDYWRMINVANGTKYWLDVHQGNPPFMSSEIDTSLDKPGQRWLVTSAGDVNDKQFSTVFSAEGTQPSTPRTTATSDSDAATSTPDSDSDNSSDSDSGGLSAGAAAGIGLAGGILLISLLVLIFWLFRRRRRNRNDAAINNISKSDGASPSAHNASPLTAWKAPTGYSPQPQTDAMASQQQQQQQQQQYGMSNYAQGGNPAAHPPTGGYYQYDQSQVKHELGDNQATAEMPAERY